MIHPIAFLVILPLLIAGCGEPTPAEAPVAANSAGATENVAENAAEAPAPEPEPLPDIVRVRLETDAGPIVVALDAKRAPVTTANFVRYAEEGRFDGTFFYRAAPTREAGGKTLKGRGFIQGGVRGDWRRTLLPIAHEPTSKTGLKHGEGAISMAHSKPGLARGDFFITAAAMPQMDAKGSEPGFAAFGRVVEGMGTVRRILAAPTVPNAGQGAMRGQMIEKPVKIVSARREP